MVLVGYIAWLEQQQDASDGQNTVDSQVIRSVLANQFVHLRTCGKKIFQATITIQGQRNQSKNQAVAAVVCLHLTPTIIIISKKKLSRPLNHPPNHLLAAKKAMLIGISKAVWPVKI